MDTLFTIICLVWGLLNLILFFKIWGACNNIKFIANKMDCNSNTGCKTNNIEEKEESLPKKELTEEEIKSNKAADLRMRYGRF